MATKTTTKPVAAKTAARAAKKPLYEGKAKKVWARGADKCVIEYKNTATAFNGEKKEDFDQKGELNCAICGLLFHILEKEGVKTHYIKTLSKTTMLVKRVEIVPLEVIVRNTAAGSFSKRFGVAEGTDFKSPTFEYCLKDDGLGDPMINKSQILAIGKATEKELKLIKNAAAKVNGILSEFFLKSDLKLVDFKLEFGRYNGKILLADEISPDTCRLWDVKSAEKLDKDRFRRDMGGFMDAYREVLKRISAAYTHE
jgi:phosphoribosylaminoimidazole-succinocarboxamide synthase